MVFDWEIAMLIQPSREVLPAMTATPAGTMRGAFASLPNEAPSKRCHMSLKRTYEETVWV